MDKGQTKFIFLGILFMLILAGVIYALTVIHDVSPRPQSGAWATNGTLAINYTLTLDNYQGFTPCNVTGFQVNLTAEWGAGSNGVFVVNQTSKIINGTTLQFNVTYVNDSPSDGWEYYISAYNLSSMNNAGCNISFQSPTYTFKVDLTNPSITLDRPKAGQNYTTNEIYVNFTTVESNPNVCYLYHNNSGSFVQNWSWVYLNSVTQDYTIDNIGEGYTNYFIRCDDLSGRTSQSANRTIFVDTTGPTITAITGNNTWSITTLTVLKANVTDTNKQACVLWLNGTAGQQELLNNMTNTTFTSGDDVSFSVRLADTTYPTPYYYNITCNDTSGQSVGLIGRAINVDSLKPSVVGITFPRYLRKSDYTPTINFTTFTGGEVDTNFLTYSLSLFNTSGTFIGQNNLTTENSSQITFTTSLSADMNYTYNITIWDMAGNINTTEFLNNSFSYQHYSVCATLYLGYNYCGIIGTSNKTMSAVATETSAQYVYLYNTTHSWVTYSAGSTTNQHVNITIGEVAVVYINSTASPTYWEDRTWGATSPYNYRTNFNLTRRNNDGYRLISVMNTTGYNFTQIELNYDNIYLANQLKNATLDFTYVNNSALSDALNNNTFIPFFYSWDINEAVTLDYGTAYWVYNYNTTTGANHVVNITGWG